MKVALDPTPFHHSHSTTATHCSNYPASSPTSATSTCNSPHTRI